GVSFLEFAQLATLQDFGLAPDGLQSADHFKAVATGFEREEIFSRGVLLCPTLELMNGYFVKDLLGEGGRRGSPAQQCRREGVGVRVQTDHPSLWICVIFYFIVHCSHDGCAGGRKRARRLHALRYAGRSPCRCFSPVLIHGNGE